MNGFKLTIKTSLLAVTLAMSTASLAGVNAHYDSDDKLKDAWIDGKVETALLINRHLNNFTIDTDVKGKTVYLTGTVKSKVDKELAGEIAKGIAGVVDVKNQLVVNKTTEMKKTYRNGEKRTWGTWYDDSTTTAVIKSKYLWSGEVDGLDINVDTIEGVVTLYGTADTPTSINSAEEIAKNTKGVVSVVNKLSVKKG